MEFTTFYVTDKLAHLREYIFVFNILQTSSFFFFFFSPGLRRVLWQRCSSALFQLQSKREQYTHMRHFSLVRSSSCRVSWTGPRTTGNIQIFIWKSWKQTVWQVLFWINFGLKVNFSGKYVNRLIISIHTSLLDKSINSFIQY